MLITKSYLRLIRLTILVFSVIFVVVGCTDQTSESSAYEEKATNKVSAERRPDKPTSIPKRQAYFGDLHVHTSYSLDSYMTFVRSTPRDAYRFARGERVVMYGGKEKQLKNPLDFVAVTEHAEFLGEFALCSTLGSTAYKDSLCVDYRNEKQDRQLASDLFRDTLLPIFTARTPQRWPICGEDGSLCADAARSVWQEIQQVNEEFNTPGEFTTFIGYEWTGQYRGNRHRNVIFRNENVPDTPWSQFEVPTPEQLWKKLDEECHSPCEVITISHNSNQSKGQRFSGLNSNGTPLTEEEAAFRAAYEPLVEIIQQKGDSECRLGLGTNDEACDFQKFDLRPICAEESINPDTNVCAPICDENGQPKACVWESDYVRNALKIGLKLEEKLEVNPYKVGIIGSTDHHNGNPGDTEEDRYEGAHGYLDDRVEDRLKLALAGGYKELSRSAGGLAGVWAEENTRDSIFAALKRRETFATSGTRILLRFFGGWNFPDTEDLNPDLNTLGYRDGVPMGADLPANKTDKAPRFLVWASKGVDGHNLQRVQIIKGWLQNGLMKERVYDVACSDGLVPDQTNHQCPDNGARVNIEDCSTGPDKGAHELQVNWLDPDFESDERAFYYARVLENPSCRWSTFDALRNGRLPPAEVEAWIQERAWSSPIWYSPSRIND